MIVRRGVVGDVILGDSEAGIWSGEFDKVANKKFEAKCSSPFRSARVSSVERCVDQPPTAFPPCSCRYQRRCYDVESTRKAGENLHDHGSSNGFSTRLT